MDRRPNSYLFAATLLTCVFGLLAVGLAYFGPPTATPSQLRLLDALITLFTTGAVTIFALLHSNTTTKHRR